MFSLLIKNARLIDGTGGPERRADIAVRDDKIVAVDDRIDGAAETIVDVAGCVVSPGFIDVQNHSDSYWQLFDNPQLDGMLSQGFTTILVGHCGASLAPILAPEGLLPLQKWHDLSGINSNWRSFEEFAQFMQSQSFGVNVASLVGYATLRRALLKDELRPLTSEEQRVLNRALGDALRCGAFGLSSGLSYAHEVGASDLELAEALKVVREFEGLFSVHLRNEQDMVVESVEEICTLASHSEVKTKISHLKVKGADHAQKLHDVLSLLDTTKHRGAALFFDLYPYETLWQPVHTYLPKWAIVGGRKHLLDVIHDPTQRNKLLQHINSLPVDIKEFVIASTSNHLNVAGKTLVEIAAGLEVSSEQALVELIDNGGSELMVFSHELYTEDIVALLRHPLALLGSDGAGFPVGSRDLVRGRAYDGLVHPRCFGATARYVRSLLDAKAALPNVIHTMTQAAAELVGLSKRGVVTEGYFADLVIFDDALLRDVATLQNPFQYCEGINYVIVNGRVAWRDREVASHTAGRFLLKA